MDIAIRIANEKALLPAANHAIFMKADWYPITAACETSVPLLQEATVSSPSKPADRKLAMNLMHLPTNAVTENDCQERFPDWTEPIHTVPVGSYESTKALLATDSGDVPCFDGATDVETFSDHDILRDAGPRSYEGNSLAKNVHAEFNADFNAIPTILGLSSPTAESLALKEDIEVLKNSCLTDCSTIEESLVDAQMSATFVQDVSSPITHAIDEALPGYFKDRISEESLSGVFLMSSRLPASRNLNPSLSRSKSIFSSEESSGSSRTTIASDLQLNDAVTTSSESLATFEVDRKPNNYFTRWSNQELECALLHENENRGNSSSHIDSEASSIVRDLTEVAITDTSSPPSICSRQSSSTLVSLESGIYSEPPENNELNSWGDGAQSEIMVEVDLEKTGKAAESVDTTPLKNVVEIHCWWKVICRGASLPLHHVRIEIGNGVVKIKFLITEMEEINFTLSNIRVQVPTSRKMWRSYSHRRLVIDGGQEQVELLASFPSDRDKLVKRIARYWRDQMLSRSKGTA
ncbi:uncharacterized protein LOC129586913 [Paramacrobiotus metropolitanus]|uniref:uncharacterized protein LOC129586913 n=1 Tax=Paramacrobiotus metropolitanus TaxID=2943436 RepID=UPI0024457B80|nr:uncharacterized protein LOC129586913 [Paramacrobiotus metropolitanus]